ncbi:GlxA family transcriptional regulator [Paracoccus sediminicola]|uniref:GlxA family transcriptional regulator n=1 Tax=Paracoccus sediminicola TaxID=3017783 RepID=UPI0022F0845D|nr:GlxA family transcriptional regulator [Paracoccus sediminicola]WBU57355.1 GlxA family transcriptional regulator [Paracoccus sediminicola]
MTGPHHVVFALLDGFTHLAFACAVDPLRIANLISDQELYRWSYVSENGETAVSSDGTVNLVHADFASIPPCDRLFVLSSTGLNRVASRELVTALRQLDRKGRGRIGALCAGTIILAQAGFLNGRKAALHWDYHDSFMEAFPEVNLVRSVFVADEKYLTASGGTATADLMLHLIREDHGSDLSVAVADQMVYSAAREASSAQKVSLQSRNGMRNAHLVRAIELMQSHLEEPLPPSAIAREIGISVRQLERLFGKYLNTSPRKYYMEMRLEKARHLLVQTEMPVTDIAFACGFENGGSFTRAYRTAYGAPPVTQRGRPAGRGTVAR